MSEMKVYKVVKFYVNRLSGVFEAETPEEAEKMFDDTSERSLRNDYIGLASPGDHFESFVEEVEK